MARALADALARAMAASDAHAAHVVLTALSGLVDEVPKVAAASSAPVPVADVEAERLKRREP